MSKWANSFTMTGREYFWPLWVLAFIVPTVRRLLFPRSSVTPFDSEPLRVGRLLLSLVDPFPLSSLSTTVDGGNESVPGLLVLGRDLHRSWQFWSDRGGRRWSCRRRSQVWICTFPKPRPLPPSLNETLDFREVRCQVPGTLSTSQVRQSRVDHPVFLSR